MKSPRQWLKLPTSDARRRRPAADANLCLPTDVMETTAVQLKVDVPVHAGQSANSLVITDPDNHKQPPNSNNSSNNPRSSSPHIIASIPLLRQLPESPTYLTFLPFLCFAKWRPYLLVTSSSSAIFNGLSIAADADLTNLPLQLVLDLTFGVRVTVTRVAADSEECHIALKLISEKEHPRAKPPPPAAQPETVDPFYLKVENCVCSSDHLKLTTPEGIHDRYYSCTGFEDYNALGPWTAYHVDWAWRHQIDWDREWWPDSQPFDEEMCVEEQYAWELEGILLTWVLAQKPIVAAVTYCQTVVNGPYPILRGGKEDVKGVEEKLIYDDWAMRRSSEMRDKMKSGTLLGPDEGKGQVIRIRYADGR